MNLPTEQPRERTSLDKHGRGGQSDCARAMAEAERVLRELALFTRRSKPACSSPANALHRRSRRVLHLEPVGGATGTVGRVLPLRHDAFEAHLAGMSEDGRAVALHVLVEPGCRGLPWPG